MPLKPIHCIVAVAPDGAIGAAGRLAWDIPEDTRQFIALTEGGVMVEGPLCYAELGKALPGRGTVVVSRDPSKRFPGAERAATLGEAVATAQAMPWPGPVWITGGERIYAEGLPLCSRLLITRIHRDFAGDRSFPADWPALFTRLVSRKHGMHEGLEYDFEIWDR